MNINLSYHIQFSGHQTGFGKLKAAAATAASRFLVFSGPLAALLSSPHRVEKDACGLRKRGRLWSRITTVPELTVGHAEYLGMVSCFWRF